MSEPLEWTAEGEQLVCRHGTATFRYDPAAMDVHWRGLTFHGVARTDLDAFVRNREDR